MLNNVPWAFASLMAITAFMVMGGMWTVYHGLLHQVKSVTLPHWMFDSWYLHARLHKNQGELRVRYERWATKKLGIATACAACGFFGPVAVVAHVPAEPLPSQLVTWAVMSMAAMTGMWCYIELHFRAYNGVSEAFETALHWWHPFHWRRLHLHLHDAASWVKTPGIHWVFEWIWWPLKWMGVVRHAIRLLHWWGERSLRHAGITQWPIYDPYSKRTGSG